MKKAPDGFSIVTVLLVFVIVGLICGAGWYVWNRNKANNSLSIEDTSQNKDSVETENIPEDTALDQQPEADYAGWKQYTNDEYGLSFYYPERLQVEELDPSDGTREFEKVELSLRLVDPKVTGSGHVMVVYVSGIELHEKIAGIDAGMTHNGFTTKHTKTEMTVSGRSAYKYLLPHDNEADRVWYFIGVGQKTYSVQTINEEAATEQSPSYAADFEKIVESL